ncbi:MAG TPA: M20/M25/M40 family metallo-hydrolase [Methanocorpusculum sp.]|nr:M20/M25/M40 family metallo-hydrolase [Methanocorpusculum sp.]
MQKPDDLHRRIFYELTKVPRPSGHLAYIQEYLISFAKAHNLAAEKDDAGNIRILHPGKTEKSLILQAHMDMVAQVEEGFSFDFTADAVQTEIKDGWLCAKRTTLGADDGSGIAIALSLLTDESLADCSMTGIFTADEESTMSGAASINPMWVHETALLNIDHEVLGEAVLSSAGGALVTARFSPDTKAVPANAEWYRLEISGLLSGHSGVDIDKGRLNAIRLAADFLSGLKDVRIAAFNGGTVDNAIPGKAEALFSTAADAEKYAQSWLDAHRTKTEPGLAVTIRRTAPHEKAYSAMHTKTLLSAILAVPDGLMEIDGRGPVLSSNLGILRADTENTSMLMFIRSSSDAKRDALADKAMEICSDTGAEVKYLGKCPGWRTEGRNELMQIADEEYQKVTGRRITFSATHGGLECGYFAEKNPDLMILSLGPTIENPHTIHERMHLGSFDEAKDLVYRIAARFCRGK